jgi:hypothetical protein
LGCINSTEIFKITIADENTVLEGFNAGTPYVSGCNKPTGGTILSCTPLIELKQYTEDIDLYAFLVINEYLKRTNKLRGQNEHKLFISFTKPHKAVSKDTITRWILMVLTNAGIDTSVYKAHSLRHAVTSKANSIGIPLSDILNKAGWTGFTMFEKFYNAPVLDNDLFSDKLLKTIEVN